MNIVLVSPIVLSGAIFGVEMEVDILKKLEPEHVQ